MLHARPSWGVGTATCDGSNATVQLLYAAIHATGQVAGNTHRPPHRMLPRPLPHPYSQIREQPNKGSLGPACRVSPLHALIYIYRIQCPVNLSSWNGSQIKNSIPPRYFKVKKKRWRVVSDFYFRAPLAEKANTLNDKPSSFGVEIFRAGVKISTN